MRSRLRQPVSRTLGRGVMAAAVFIGTCSALMIAPSYAATTEEASADQPVVASSLDATDSGSGSTSDISIWVENAPLNLVVQQLAQISGRKPVIDGGLEGTVSGRFNGSLSDTLESLSGKYPVVFDITDDSLFAINRESQRSVSIALTGPALTESMQNELLSSTVPGNEIDFRDDAVRVSGHPSFVKRTARLITESVADAGTAKVNSKSVAEAATPSATVTDAGSVEMLADIEDETKPPAEQATLSKPIRWVTDIPGYNTF